MSYWRCWPDFGEHPAAGSGHRTSRCCCCGCSASSRRPAAAASYQQAEAPVSQLINDFGPPVASPAAARQRAAMPFVHLERELWDLRAAGDEIGPDAPERRGRILDHGTAGRLRAPAERLLSNLKTLATAARPP